MHHKLESIKQYPNETYKMILEELSQEFHINHILHESLYSSKTVQLKNKFKFPYDIHHINFHINKFILYYIFIFNIFTQINTLILY